jgi:hypothetical protein
MVMARDEIIGLVRCKNFGGFRFITAASAPILAGTLKKGVYSLYEPHDTEGGKNNDRLLKPRILS